MSTHTTPDYGEYEYIYPEGGLTPFEEEDPEEILAIIGAIIQILIAKVLPDPKRVLTLQQAGKCLSTLGKIWNLTECHAGCDNDSIKCGTSDQRLLDMEGYVDEYQYLNIEAVDMALTDIRIIPEHFIWLLTVDLSGNSLTNISACPLTKLQNVVSIKLNRNRIVDPYLKPMKHLQYLGLNSNQIQSLHRIYHPNLSVLDVNRNEIRAVYQEDCWKLIKMKQLELRGNRLTSTSGLKYENLEILYLAENQITKLEGMGSLPKLRRLHLRDNPLSELSSFTEENGSLEYLNLRSCQIESVDELKKLRVLTGLRVLVTQNNPFHPSDLGQDQHPVNDDEVRLQILAILPQLKRINKRVVTLEEFRNAEALMEDDED